MPYSLFCIYAGVKPAEHTGSSFILTVARVKPSKRLLFVDDERAIRETLAAILRRYGFTITVAGTVSDALAEIRKQQFDLLLCDLNIESENDGYQVIHAIKAIDPACVTVVLTGCPQLESAIGGIHQGVDDYIIKPAKADALVALLAEKLAARQQKSEATINQAAAD
jgi:DNA-binding NtrC family response regulator